MQHVPSILLEAFMLELAISQTLNGSPYTSFCIKISRAGLNGVMRSAAPAQHAAWDVHAEADPCCCLGAAPRQFVTGTLDTMIGLFVLKLTDAAACGIQPACRWQA